MPNSSRQNILNNLYSTPALPVDNQWQDIRNAKLWEFVALSLNYDPNQLDGWSLGISKVRAPKSFLNRLRLAVSNLSEGKLLAKTVASPLENSVVNVNDFKKWAELINIELPSLFTSKEFYLKQTITERNERIKKEKIELIKNKHPRPNVFLSDKYKLSIHNIKKITAKPQPKKSVSKGGY